MKGYHTKTINYMISYKQNQINRPRLIISSVDGLLACWNVDTDGPAFKFLMNKKGKQVFFIKLILFLLLFFKLLSSNDGQEILSMTYDNTNYKLVTLTEDYITVWSSLSGMETKRFKNSKNLKQISFWNHSG